MAELSMEEMVKAIYEKVVVGSNKTPFGIRGASFSAQPVTVVPPDPLTEEFAKNYWYDTVLERWVVADHDYLTPNQPIDSHSIIAPGVAPEGWEWAYNPDTKMIAARKMCGPIGSK
jgi:hypothetical protein